MTHSLSTIFDGLGMQWNIVIMAGIESYSDQLKILGVQSECAARQPKLTTAYLSSYCTNTLSLQFVTLLCYGKLVSNSYEFVRSHSYIFSYLVTPHTQLGLGWCGFKLYIFIQIKTKSPTRKIVMISHEIMLHCTYSKRTPVILITQTLGTRAPTEMAEIFLINQKIY